jgi:hypothetical protein
MPDAPSPITSPPAQPWQPHDASAPGIADTQSTPEHVYDAAGGTGADPWPKIRQGGAADMATGAASPGDWRADGTTNNAAAWKQT